MEMIGALPEDLYVLKHVKAAWGVRSAAQQGVPAVLLRIDVSSTSTIKGAHQRVDAVTEKACAVLALALDGKKR
jgi:hypothetical protein